MLTKSFILSPPIFERNFKENKKYSYFNRAKETVPYYVTLDCRIVVTSKLISYYQKLYTPPKKYSST